DDGWAAATPLTRAQLDVLARAGDQPITLDLPGLGSYRVLAATTADGERVAVGVPTEEMDRTLAGLVRLEVLATLLGVALSGVAGAWVVRRQMAPLREVADTAHRVSSLSLAEGEIGDLPRVPAHLTRADTEVGQVGDSLNRLLDHV